MAKRVKALGSGQHTVPASRHSRVSRSRIAYSRMMSAIADPKIRAVPTMLPNVVCPPRQNGTATSSATRDGTVTASAIQDQLSSLRAAVFDIVCARRGLEAAVILSRIDGSGLSFAG